MYRIVFMGTPEFAVPSLESLLHTQEVVGVVTQPDRPAGRGKQLQPSAVKQFALSAGLPLYQPASLRSLEAAAPLRDWRPDAVIVAAFGQILRPHVLALPRLGCYNVHASLLPRWRGAAPIQHAILAGDRKTGITLMGMDAGLDTGPIFMQEAINILPDDTAADVHDRLAMLGGDMLARYLGDILSGRLPPLSQDDERATYAPMIKKEMGRIDWSQPAAAIVRQVLAMTPWPSAYTTWNEQPLKILSASPADDLDISDSAPGDVVKSGDRILIAAGAGAVELTRVQLAGKRAVTIDDFVRGRSDFVGSRLGDGS